jgi:hypothetical protein
MVVEFFEEPTPSGALSWDVQYMSNSGKPTDKASAAFFIIHEYSEHGILLRSHFGYFAD